MIGTLVITTIAAPTPAVRRCRELLRGWRVIVVGDRKTPTPWNVEGIDFIPFDPSSSALASAIPANSYSRKNLGYVAAIAGGAQVIAETDDDNFPYDDYGRDLRRAVMGSCVRDTGWINVYQAFTEEPIWPRGLPLPAIAPSLGHPPSLGDSVEVDCPVQQFLADGDPDVDAIYRLTIGRNVRFAGVPIILLPGSYTPMNSQNTVWWPEAYHFLYLPSYVSWRATDIWRGLIVTAISNTRDWAVAVRPPTMRQDRNEHDLMRDFREEIPVYLETEDLLHRLIAAVENCPDNPSCLRAAYQTLLALGLVPKEELALVDAWNEALATVQ